MRSYAQHSARCQRLVRHEGVDMPLSSTCAPALRRAAGAATGCLAALAVLFVLPAARATTLSYVAVDLPDTVVGQDRWAYLYQVGAGSFLGGEGFSVYFDPALYEALEAVPTGLSQDWNVLVAQPDASLPVPGLYDAMALIDLPSIAGSFRVDFNWLGQNTPSSQPFDIHDATFLVMQTGMTQAVPEPATVALMLEALAAIGLTWPWRRRSQTFSSA